MQAYEVCGNYYESLFTVKFENGEEHFFDAFECAIEKLAPHCAACNCCVIGHGVQHEDTIYCSAHCARSQGISGLMDHN